MDSQLDFKYNVVRFQVQCIDWHACNSNVRTIFCYFQQERENYEYIISEGKITHKQTGELLDTTGESQKGKWIFVMSTYKKLYAGKVIIWWANSFNSCITKRCFYWKINYKDFYISSQLTLFSYVQKKKGMFHHSSFLAGGTTLAAGRLAAVNGIL